MNFSLNSSGAIYERHKKNDLMDYYEKIKNILFLVHNENKKAIVREKRYVKKLQNASKGELFKIDHNALIIYITFNLFEQFIRTVFLHCIVTSYKKRSVEYPKLLYNTKYNIFFFF